MGSIVIDDRVLVDGKSGVVRFAGLTEFCDGFWYGVELDLCEGFNDGSVNGKRYFHLQSRSGNYGIFAQLDDLVKIDDSVALRDENKKLTGVVKVLERKIRQMHLQRNQDISVVELQRTLENLIQERDDILQENLQLKATVQTLEAKESLRETDMINYVQKENDALSKKLRALTEQLNESREENKQLEALQAVYAEIEAELRDQLKELEDHIRSIKIATSKRPISGDEAAKTALFADLCSAVFPKGQTPTHLLRLQYEFLLRCLENGEFNLPVLNELIGRMYFSVLRQLTTQASQTKSSEVLDLLDEKFSNNRVILNMLLACHFEPNLLEVSQLIDSIKGLESLDSSLSLIIPLLLTTFGDLMPHLLAYHRKKGLSDDMSTIIGNLYALSLSIRDQAEQLDEKARSDPKSSIVCDIRLSHILEVVTALIRCDPCSDHRSFRGFEVKLNEILAKICQVKCNPAQVNVTASTSHVDHTKLEEEQDNKKSILESELSEKDATIRELMIKTQLLELKLDDRVQAPLPQTEKSATDLSRSHTPNDENLRERQLSQDGSIPGTDESGAPSRDYFSNFDGSLASQKMNNEVSDLRRVVASLTKRRHGVEPDFEWLYSNHRITKTSEVKHIELKNKVHDVAMSAMEVLRHTRITTYQDDQSEKQKLYMASAIFRQKVLDSKLRDLSA